LNSHYCAAKLGSNEIWGLDFNPNDNDIFYTCGDDATLRSWSIS